MGGNVGVRRSRIRTPSSSWETVSALIQRGELRMFKLNFKTHSLCRIYVGPGAPQLWAVQAMDLAEIGVSYLCSVKMH